MRTDDAVLAVREGRLGQQDEEIGDLGLATRDGKRIARCDESSLIDAVDRDGIRLVELERFVILTRSWFATRPSASTTYGAPSPRSTVTSAGERVASANRNPPNVIDEGGGIEDRSRTQLSRGRACSSAAREL